MGWGNDPVVKGWGEGDQIVKTPSAPRESPTSLRNIGGAGLEPMVSLLTGAAAQPVAGLAGLGSLATGGKDPSGVIERTQRALTYQPRTEGGKTALGAISRPFELYGKGARYIGEKAADLVGLKTGATVETALQVAPMALGIRKPTPTSVYKPKPTVEQQTFLDAQKLGMKLPPAELNPSFLNTRLESLGGKDALTAEASVKNVEVAKKAASRALGVPETTELTPEVFAARKEVIGKPYEELASRSPLVKKQWDRLRTVRADAKAQWAYFNRNLNPRERKKAELLDKQADRIEQSIAVVAARIRPDLMADVVKARKSFAELYQIERSWNEANAKVDPKHFAKLLRQKQPLSGELKTVGQFARGPGSKYVSTTASRPGVGFFEPLAAAALAGEGVMATGKPWGAALGAVPFVRGGARSLALSPWYQKRFAVPDTTLRTTLPQGAEQALILSLLSGKAVGSQP